MWRICTIHGTQTTALNQNHQAISLNNQPNMNNILTGAAMGAALTVTGVYEPSVILAQFNFSDFSMLQTFLTAAAGST